MSKRKPATVNLPDFHLTHRRESQAVINTGSMACYAVMWLIINHSDFKTGWFMGSYKRLQELMTPPKPERGPQPKGPSLQEVRSAIDKLIAAGVLWRDASNLHNKQLRLRVWPRDVEAASADLTNSYLNRAEKRLHPAFTRVPRRSRGETKQLSQQGYQQLNSLPPTPTKNGSYPQSEAKAKALRAIGELLDGLPRREKQQSPASGGTDRAP